jgi:mono/diheme cytochrome c family protein
MRNAHSASGYMNLAITVMMAGLAACSGCTGNHAGGEKSRIMADSATVADSAVQTAVAQPVKSISYEERQGAFLYNKYCAVCHGGEGKGDGFNAFNLEPRPRDLSDSTYMRALSDDQIVQTISGGGRSVNKSALMPAYGWTLNSQQIRDLSTYVRSFSQVR